MCDTAAMPALDPSLPVPLAMVVAGLQAMAAQIPADIPGAQALLEAQVLLNQTDVIKALSLQRIADVDTRQLHTLDDSPSTSAWVAEQQTSMRRSDVALARKLDRVPLVAARIAAGGLSLAGGVQISQALGQLRRFVDRPDGQIDQQPADQALYGVIVNGVSSLVAEAKGGLADDDPRLLEVQEQATQIFGRPATEIARVEAAFLLLARHVEPGQLKSALSRLVDALLPNQLADRAEDAHRDRRLDLHRDEDGSGWTVRGRLDLECGELLHVALAAAMDTDPENPRDTEAAEQLRALGVDPYDQPCLEVRSRTQRRHDGLKLLLRKLLDTGALGLRGKHVPNVNITISEGALHDQPGALPARAGSGATWPAGLARKLLCDSAITRFVLSLGHRVVESSHTERTAKPHERKIKQVETGGICQGAGCGRGDPTGHRLIPHHVTAYAICGTTSLDDTVLVCEVTHHDLHEGGKTIRLKDGRRLNATGWITGIAA
jgi:hypothetical protein